MTVRRREKRPTGIIGLDEMTGGGLPASGVTLLAGATGTGKTVLALQIAAGAAAAGSGAVFASFEESEDRLRTSAAAFTWSSALDDPERFTVLDARPPAAGGASGSFGLEGLIAILEATSQTMTRPWVILDGIDQLLVHQPAALDAAAQMLELDAWSERTHVPVIVTGKVGDTVSLDDDLLGTFEFLVPTSIRLSTTLVGQRLARRLRIVKYRGARHVTDNVPMVMDDEGVQLPYGASVESIEPASGHEHERVSTGIERLDKVLGGGLYRGSAVLISGSPGTAKTTLSASIAEAAAERGERVLYVTFDEARAGIVRNAASVGIELTPHLEEGRLRIVSRTAWSALADEHFLEIHKDLEEDRPDVLVIDPVSALLKQEDQASAYLSIDRILGVARARAVTAVLTSLVTTDSTADEDTRSRASTLADTWISLTNHLQRGERNRALTVVKSRGTPHSNQMRELVLSDDGVDLIDVYPYGSDVLMGTARVHEQHQRVRKARAARAKHEAELQSLEEAARDVQQRREEVDREQRRLDARLEAARAEAEELSRADEAERSTVRGRRLPPGAGDEPARGQRSGPYRPDDVGHGEGGEDR